MAKSVSSHTTAVQRLLAETNPALAPPFAVDSSVADSACPGVHLISYSIEGTSAQDASLQRHLVNPHDDPPRWADRHAAGGQKVYLAVVFVDARVLERIKQRLLQIIKIAPSPVGWEGVHRQRDPSTGGWLARHIATEQRTDRFLKAPPFAADDGARPNAPPVVVDAGRPGEFESQRHLLHLFHGGELPWFC